MEAKRRVAEPKITKLFDESEIASRVEELAPHGGRPPSKRFRDRWPADRQFCLLRRFRPRASPRWLQTARRVLRLAVTGLGESSGNVRLIGEFEPDLIGRTVLSLTTSWILGVPFFMRATCSTENKVSGILTCALVDKPSRRQVEIGLISSVSRSDVFIVGYGIDYAHEIQNCRTSGDRVTLDIHCQP